MAFLFQGNF